jgi:hypothetical protein
MKYGELTFRRFYDTLCGGSLSREELLAIWLYMKTVYPDEEFNPVLVVAEFSSYATLNDWNEDLKYEYDSWAEVALDHTVIQFDGMILVADERSGFKHGLFSFCG